MTGYRESFLRAVQRDRIPNKLRIQNKAIVVEADCPIFQRKWKEHIRKTEIRFIQILTDHLKNKNRRTDQNPETPTHGHLREEHLHHLLK